MTIAQLHPKQPAALGLMIVYQNTAVVIGQPGPEHGQFFAQVKHWSGEHIKAGSPRSGGWRGQQYDL